MIIFYLRSKGCEWSCQVNGGCFMCGHYFGTSKGKDLPLDSYVNQFEQEFIKYNFSNIPMICIYNAGSILNNKEMKLDELIKILKIVNTNKDIKRIVIESRPEFINYEVLSKTSKVCKGKIVEIGIGLETTNDYIRSKCINKGFDFNCYIESVCKIRKFSNIKVLTYITVNPIFLTITESIKDVINSIEVIADYTDIISLEPSNIQKHTLVVSNCEMCNNELYNAINMYNSTRSTHLLRELVCQCEDNYLREKLKDTNECSIEERINKAMNYLLIEVIG